MLKTLRDLFQSTFFIGTDAHEMIMNTDFIIAFKEASWKQSREFWILVTGFVFGLFSLIGRSERCKYR